MRVREHLRSGGTLEDLAERLGVVAKPHPRWPNLVLLKYDQIDSPLADPLVQECRGIVLDSADDWRPVCLPFGKFFNHGEPNAVPIDWSTARVQEKLDGTLCTLWHYAGEWHVATTGSPDAGGSVGELPFSFATFFWTTFRALGLEAPPAAEADLCFMFELTAAENRVVVDHREPRITLLAVRNRVTGEELDPTRFADRWPVVRHYEVGSIEGLLALLETVDPIAQEGFVVVDGTFTRTKLKHPQYVALHSMMSSRSTRRFVELVRINEHEEVLAYFPKWRADIDPIVERFERLVASIEADLARLAHHADQKAFAAEATQLPWSGALFAVRRGKSRSVREYLAQMPIDRLLDFLGLRREEGETAGGAPG